MPFLELSLTVDADHQARAEDALTELGALAITLRDANADTPDEHAIFEPGVGELPQWPHATLSALFAADRARAALTAALHAALPWLDPAQLRFADVADQAWERAWMDEFHPMQFGRRLWIYPWNVEPPAAAAGASGGQPERVVVRLDPGLAFGSGTHPTTALCLEWLDAQPLAGRVVVDYGCGSGILAIAALRLGAARAIGIDNDPQALTASRDNAQRNGVDAGLALCCPEDYAAAPADFLVANILAAPLSALAPVFAESTRAGGGFAISGLLAGQEAELMPVYARWFEDLAVSARDGWVRISGRRRG